LGIRIDSHLDDQYSKIKEESKAFFDKLSDKEKKYFIAYRLQMLKTTDEVINDSKVWWNKLREMPEEDI
jgi:hypothetical protein